MARRRAVSPGRGHLLRAARSPPPRAPRPVLQEWLQQQSSRALQQKLAATLAGAALLLVLGRGVAEANTITVNATVPGVVADGKCSLIEAIINANDTVTGGPPACR